MHRTKTQALAILLILSVASPVYSAVGPDFKLFMGVADLGNNNQGSAYGFSYLSGKHLTGFNLRPEAGIMRTRNKSHYVFLGLTRESYVSKDAPGLIFSVDFAPGLYSHGDGSDTDLGYWLQFRSGINIYYEFSDHTRLGLGYHHLSNGSLSDDNPGTETLLVNYSVNW